MNKHYPIIPHLIPPSNLPSLNATPSYDNWLRTDLYFSKKKKKRCTPCPVWYSDAENKKMKKTILGKCLVHTE